MRPVGFGVSPKSRIRLAILVVLWGPIFAMLGGGASGQTAPFQGWQIGAIGAGASFTYDQPSLGVPAKPTGEMNLAYAEAKHESGPTGYGLASHAWPGQVAAALPTFLQGEVKRQCPECPDLPALPGYPIRAEAFHPQGPPEESSDLGTMRMAAQARVANADAQASVAKSTIPTVGTMAGLASRATSEVLEEATIATIESSADGISMLGGLVKIDAVVSRAVARSDGVKATLTGRTVVMGASVQGNEVSIDHAGVHAGGSDGDTAVLDMIVKQTLGAAGIDMRVAAPVDTVEGSSASRALGGLLVRFNGAKLLPYAQRLPEPMRSEILDNIPFDEVITVSFATAAVASTATPIIEFGGPTTPIDPVVPPGGSGGAEVPVGDTTSGGASNGSATPGGAGGSPATGLPSGPLVASPASNQFAGVPMPLFILALIAAVGLTWPMVRIADRAVAARVGGRCPWESA